MWTSRPRICHALYRAPVYPSRCPYLFASLFHVYLPLHLSAAALHTLSPAANPVIGRRAYPHDFPYPHPSSLAPRTSATFCTRFLYLLREFTDQHDRLDHDERSVSRTSVKILGVYSVTRTFVVFFTAESPFAIYVRSVFREHWGNLRTRFTYHHVAITMTVRRLSYFG